MRAFLAFLYSLLLTPALALAQAQGQYGNQPYAEAEGAHVMTWFWWASMAAVLLIALLAYGRARDRHHRRRPPATPV